MFAEFQTHFLKWKLMFVTCEHCFGMALGIPQNTEYIWGTLPKGTSTFRNVLEFTYGFPMTQSGLQAFSWVLPPSPSKYSIVV